MAAPLVSVVLPTRDRAHTLPRALESVLAQTFQNLEVVVVDDGSTDDTRDVLAPFLGARVRCVCLDPGRGAAAARNAGIGRSTGEYLAFQDSDDEWIPDKLEAQVEALRGHPAACLTYGDMERVLASGEVRPFPAPDVRMGRIVDPATRFYQVHNIGIQSTLIRRDAIDTEGGFDERMPALEDLELFLRLALRHPLHHLRRPVVRYHETPGLSSDDARRVRARARLLRIHGRATFREDPLFFAREWINVKRGERRMARGSRPEKGAARSVSRVSPP